MTFFPDACEIALGQRPEPHCPMHAIRRQLRMIEAMDLNAQVEHHLHGIRSALDGFSEAQQQDALVHATALIGLAGALKAHALDIVTTVPAKMNVDGRDANPMGYGIFRDHNCSPCRDGQLPCVKGNANQCDNPRARND